MSIADAFEAAVQVRRLAGDSAAIAEFEALLERAPDSLDIKRHLAECVNVTGNVDLARALFEDILSSDPEDVVALIELALLARNRGDDDVCLLLLERARASRPHLFWPKVHWAVEVRGRGRFDDALVVFREALAIEPTNTIALHEIGLTLLRLNRPDEAVAFFDKALAIDPENMRLRLELCAALRHAGRFGEARALFAEPTLRDNPRVRFEIAITDVVECPDGGGAEQLQAVFDDHADQVVTWLNEDVRECFISEDPFQLGARLYLRQHAGFDDTHMSTEDVKSIVLDAIVSARPFSLLRAGDGEGAFLAYAQRFGVGPLGRLPGRLSGDIMGHQIWRTWTGLPMSSLAKNELDIIKYDLEYGFATADVAGIPQLKQLAGAAPNYIHLHGLVEAHRFVSKVCRARTACCAVNVRLYEVGAYDLWLKEVKSLGVITCHPGLAASIANRFGIVDFVEHIVPFQRGFAEVFGYGTDTERHFPNVYERLRLEIPQYAKGRVYLVAAGVFGKAYCSWVKLAGGIGLDIGGMADAFAGFNTRPSIAAAVLNV